MRNGHVADKRTSHREKGSHLFHAAGAAWPTFKSGAKVFYHSSVSNHGNMY